MDAFNAVTENFAVHSARDGSERQTAYGDLAIALLQASHQDGCATARRSRTRPNLIPLRTRPMEVASHAVIHARLSRNSPVAAPFVGNKFSYVF